MILATTQTDSFLPLEDISPILDKIEIEYRIGLVFLFAACFAGWIATTYFLTWLMTELLT